MGSTNTGRFTDYPGTPSGSSKTGSGNGSGGSGGGGQGGGSASKTDQCLHMIESVALEEVARSEYFITHKILPPTGTAVAVRSSLVGGRIGVETVPTLELVGLLPTEYNYLLQCMKQGYKYPGKVISTTSKPIPVVRVNLEPRK